MQLSEEFESLNNYIEPFESDTLDSAQSIQSGCD